MFKHEYNNKIRNITIFLYVPQCETTRWTSETDNIHMFMFIHRTFNLILINFDKL